MTSQHQDAADLPGDPPVVLVVEDDAVLGQLIQRILVAHGYTAVLALSGRSALVLHAAHVDDLALVLCDIRLPGMDGVATLEALHRAQPDLLAVTMSGVALTDAQEARLAACGAAAHILKPFDVHRVVSVVQEVIATRGRQVTSAGQDRGNGPV